MTLATVATKTKIKNLAFTGDHSTLFFISLYTTYLSQLRPDDHGGIFFWQVI